MAREEEKKAKKGSEESDYGSVYLIAQEESLEQFDEYDHIVMSHDAIPGVKDPVKYDQICKMVASVHAS